MENPLKKDKQVKKALSEMLGEEVANQLVSKDVTKYTKFDKLPATNIKYSEQRFRNSDGTVTRIPNN